MKVKGGGCMSVMRTRSICIQGVFRQFHVEYWGGGGGSRNMETVKG
jgi:hypothetical protein